MRRLLVLLAAMAVITAACSSEPAAEETTTTTARESTTTSTLVDVEPMAAVEFTVTIENISGGFDIFDSGAFAVPVGADDPAPALPGSAYEFEVKAGRGHRLSFASMFVQSNDWFFATPTDGLALYDQAGNPVSGDVTDSIALYDAGTEEDQTPGEGADQAPRQAGPNTGAVDPDSTVREVTADVPDVADLVTVTVTPGDEGLFAVRIENISDGSSLATPLAPGVYAVHEGGQPLFSLGETDRGDGLEAIAEDGDPNALGGVLAARTGVATPLAPGAYAVHGMTTPLFMVGTEDAGAGLEAIAEDGDPTALVAALPALDAVSSAGVFAVPSGMSDPGPLPPGERYRFTFTAEEGAYLSLATMFVQSNDWFFATPAEGIMLFADGGALDGDITSMIGLYDAGTEVDQTPGIGADQAPRQAGPDTGAEQGAPVSAVDWPVDSYIRVTIEH